MIVSLCTVYLILFLFGRNVKKKKTWEICQVTKFKIIETSHVKIAQINSYNKILVSDQA